MFGLGMTEIIVILAVAFVLFGAKRLPEIGRSIGRGLREFKNGLTGLEELPEAKKEEPKKLKAKGKARKG